MAPTVKSEIRKLLTIRSTYIIVVLALALTVLFAFYFEGYRGNTGSPASNLESTALTEIITNGVGLGVLFTSIIAILFMAHEFHHNLITYTLTANARRTQVLLAKLLVIVGFSVAYGLLAIGVALGGYLFGLSLRDASLPAQEFDAVVEISRVMYFYAGYALLGTLVALIAKSLVAAIAGFMIYITTVEPLASLLIKDNSKYLPVHAIDTASGVSMSPYTLSTGMAVAVSAAYLVASMLIMWLIFVRRDVS